MNWGTRIVLGMVTFMLFITGMVIYMFKVHKDDPLIEENYYEKGINYNAEYDATKNVLNDDATPKISITTDQLIIELKEEGKYTLKLLRPSKGADDVKFEGTTTGDKNLIIVDKSKLAKGMWFLNLQWVSQGKDYFYKDNITL